MLRRFHIQKAYQIASNFHQTCLLASCVDNNNEFQVQPSSQSIVKYNHFLFSRSIKSSTQVILHSNAEIQNMHNRQQKKQKQKNWQIFSQKNDKVKISLVGLPNCGKSSLFNCVAGQRMAIVDKEYGMTRDRRQYTILEGLASIIDTPGVQVSLLGKTKNKKQSMYQQQTKTQNVKQLKEDIFQQTMKAINESDFILFVIDSKKGVISDQQMTLAKYLKAFNSIGGQKGKKCQIIIVCNKCDGGDWDEDYFSNEIYSKLSLLLKSQEDAQTKEVIQNLFFCSSQQGTGIFQVLNYINDRIPYQLKKFRQKRGIERSQKFELLVKKMKQQIHDYNHKLQDAFNASVSEDTQKNQINNKKGNLKKIKIKQWQNDFRNLNPNPEENEQLDSENYQEFFLSPNEAFSSGKRGVDIKNLRMKNSIKICFIGKPNVGKSSLINQLLGQDKMIVSDVPHTTRDSLTTKILYKNRKIQLIDTAGLNTPRIVQNDEQFIRKAQFSTMIHVRQSQVVVYVMDAFSSFSVDDFTLIKQVIQQGRPIIIVLNKWQAIKEQYKLKAKRFLMNQIQKNLGDLHGNPLVFVSVKMMQNIDLMMDKIINGYDKWNMRISTGLLNNWLEKFKKLDNLPKDKQVTLKINYVIQAKVRPPHFVFFVNNKSIFKENYMRFLMKNMAEQFQLDGIPLRTTLRSTNNKQNQIKNKKKQEKKKKVSKIKTKMDELKKKYGDFTI